MDDNKSLISISKGFDCSFQRFWKHNNCFVPFLGFLVFLICLLFIFSVLLRKGKLKNYDLFSIFPMLDISCDDHWSKFDQSCFKLVMNYSDIKVCRKDCQREGADLASVHSKEENDFIVTLLEESPTWIAGSITEKDGDFFWLDGSAWDFENWDEGSLFGPHFVSNLYF